MLERTSLHTGLLGTRIFYQPTWLILVHCVISGKLSPGSIYQNFLLLISLQFVLVNTALSLFKGQLLVFCLKLLSGPMCFVLLAFIVTNFCGKIND